MREFETTAPIMFISTRNVVLATNRRYGSPSAVSDETKLPHSQCSVGKNSGGKVKIVAVSGLRLAVSIQPIGSRMNSVNASSRAYTAAPWADRRGLGSRTRVATYWAS